MLSSLFFFFNDTATTEIYTLSLHDALPISGDQVHRGPLPRSTGHGAGTGRVRLHRVSGEQGAVSAELRDRKSTRLNSSHSQISYAVFCLKKKKNTTPRSTATSTSHTTRRPP